MKSRSGWVTALALAAALTAFTTAAQAYFVRPFLQLGGSTIDGIEINGATERSESFTSALQSDVSLGNGTLRTFLEITGPGNRGQAAGVMGDTLSFDNAAGTNLTFNFDFDGTINAPERDPNLNSTLQIGVFVSFYVFESGSGATYLNFNQHPGALVDKFLFLEFNNPSAPLQDLLVQQSLSGSFAVVGAGRHSYDVFYGLSTFVNMNDNPGTVSMDFSHTATAGVLTAPGVVFTSESGTFLGSGPTVPIPEPGTYLLMALGLAAVLKKATHRQQRQPR